MTLSAIPITFDKRLLTQELALMKDLRSPRQAFERQSKLPKDAFQDRQS